MELIVYIALAIPFVGFLFFHVATTRDRFDEAVRSGATTPALQIMLVRGIVALIAAIVIPGALLRSAADWPSVILSVIFLVEAGCDFWYTARLRRLSSTDHGQRPE